jgi:hypothetical protein
LWHEVEPRDGQLARLRGKIEPAERGERIGQVVRRFRQRAGPVRMLFTADDRRACEHGIGDHPLRINQIAAAHANAGIRCEHGIMKHANAAWHVVVRLDVDRIAEAVDRHVAVKREIAFTLKQRFGRVLVKKLP